MTARGRTRGHRGARPTTVALVAVALAGLLGPAACGDGQPEWCEELASVGDLEELASAITTSDGPTATEELDRFEDVAAAAPEAVRSDMEAIASTLRDVVAVAMAGESADADELELQRDAANQRLAEMPAHIAAVTGWAEEECGIRLD